MAVEECVKAGIRKANMKSSKAFLLAVFAGVFIALGSVGSVVSAVTLHGAAERVVRALVFPAGLTFVLIAGAELFTGNCLMLMAVFEGKITLKRMVFMLAVVYAGNAVGSLLAAEWTAASGIMQIGDGWVGRAFAMMAAAKMRLTWGEAFLRGAGCNFLVCLAVWMGYSAKSAAGKVISLWPAVFLFVVCAMEHSIANMSAVPTGMIAAKIYALKDIAGVPSGADFLWKNLIPVTLGNIAGGAAVAAGYWATSSDCIKCSKAQE